MQEMLVLAAVIALTSSNVQDARMAGRILQQAPARKDSTAFWQALAGAALAVLIMTVLAVCAYMPLPGSLDNYL